MIRPLLALLLLPAIQSSPALDDMLARAKTQGELFAALQSGESGEAPLARLESFWKDPSSPEPDAVVEITRAAQSLLLFGKGRQAFGYLEGFAKAHPKAESSPLFCYQFFFTALYGAGNRETARAILERLTREVNEGRLPDSSPEYIAVTNGWYRAIAFADSDLPRQQHLNTRAAISHARR